MKLCSVDGCEQPTGVPGSARGYCKNDYMRLYRTGSVEGKRKPLPDRLWSYVDRSDPAGCCPWVGHVGVGGYGVIRIEGRNARAHRIAWQISHPDEPPLTPVETICHRCDNPPCCRPDHLFRGTPAANSADMTAKGRQARGRALWSVKLTESQAVEIRERYAAGGVRQVDLATEFGVSQPQISSIIRGVSWK